MIGCKEEINSYSGEDVVYINETTDTTKLSFTYVDGEFKTQIKNIVLKTMGDVYDYDRKVQVEVVTKNCIENVDYIPLKDSYIIKAGETSIDLPVEMIRTEALQRELKFITVKLLESDDFKLHFEFGSTDISWWRSKRLIHTIQFSELMTEAPKTWDPYFFDAFSSKKFTLMCDVLKISRSKFIDEKYMIGYRLTFTASSMKQYLMNEKNAGRTVYEEDGVTEMKMGRGAI